MLVIRKHGKLFIVEWEGMDIEFTELPKALTFIETIFKFTAMEIGMEELVQKAAAYDAMMERQSKASSDLEYNRKY